MYEINSHLYLNLCVKVVKNKILQIFLLLVKLLLINLIKFREINLWLVYSTDLKNIF